MPEIKAIARRKKKELIIPEQMQIWTRIVNTGQETSSI